ncbi:MAG: FAD-dependent oxidoreductase, partial [Pontimonas sp.]
MRTVAVIGGGHAGDEVVAQLRERGFAGSITLVEESLHIPYERPPLSKEFLTQHLEPSTLAIRGAAFYQQHDTTHRLGVAVVGIDPSESHVKVHFEGGSSEDYDAIVLATGMQPRKLPVPGAEATGVHYLQGLTDATALR